MFKLALVLVVTACAHDEQVATPHAQGDCAAASAGFAKAAKAVEQRCTSDHWTADATTCFATATTSDAREACSYKHLTREQADQLDKVPGLGGDIDQVLDEIAAYKTKMCACKTPDCARKLSDEMNAWSDKLAKEFKQPPKLTDEQTKRGDDLSEELQKCMEAAMTADTPPSPGTGTALAITGVEPANGDAAGGTYVKLKGSRFIADGARSAKVYFGSRQGTVVRFASDSELIVEAPGGKAGETVDVLVIFEPGGEIKLPKSFTFVAKKP
jgi:IPT/TIG domain-containing protein